MAAPTRHKLVLPDGKEAELSVSVGDSFAAVVLKDGAAIDISGDTLTVAAKLDTTAKTLTIAAVSPQTGADKGKCIVTIPAAQIGAAGTLYVDLKRQASGEEAKIFDRWEIPVVDSSAD